MKELQSHNVIRFEIETVSFLTGRFFILGFTLQSGHKGRRGRLHKGFHKVHKEEERGGTPLSNRKYSNS